MKLFSRLEESVKDERVINEYYKAGYHSFFILIYLILLDCIIRGAILGRPEDIVIPFIFFFVSACFFMISLIRKGVWMCGLSRKIKKKRLIICALLAVIIAPISHKISSGYLAGYFGVDRVAHGWLVTLLFNIFFPAFIAFLAFLFFMKISEKRAERIIENEDG